MAMMYLFSAGDNLITTGQTSKDFFFNTLPTSQPMNLECADTTFERVKATWKNPIIGMDYSIGSSLDNDYKFKFSLIRGKYDILTLQVSTALDQKTCFQPVVDLVQNMFQPYSLFSTFLIDTHRQYCRQKGHSILSI